MPDGISDTDLAGIVDTAAAFFGGAEDSEVEVPEEQPEEAPEEDADDLDDEDDLGELDDDLDDEDDDQDLDEDDDDDLEDLDDEDDEEDDLDEDDDAEESDEDSDDDDDDQEDPQLHTVKVQGQEFQVTTEELRAGYQRQQDYTLKTQQLSDIYNKMSSWYEERANNPEFWVQEIVSGQDNPADTIAGAIRGTGDATILLGQTIKTLVESGDIAEEVVEALNLQHIAEQAKDQTLHLKVQSLEQQLQQQNQQTVQQQEYQQVEQEINRQWAGLGLQFEDAAQEHDAKLELLSFAHARGIPNLQDAYALKLALAGDQAAPATPQARKKKQAKSAVKKRKTAAMSRKPTGGSSPGSKASKKSADPVLDAATTALAELGLE